MKKTILFISLLWLPFWASAQWSVNINGGAGIAKEWERQPPNAQSTLPTVSFYSTPGYSFQGGIDAIYYITPHFGLGSGVVYSHNRSLDDYIEIIKIYWHSETIKIPLTLQWTLGSSLRSTIQFGFYLNINLRQHEFDSVGSITYRDKPFFMGLRLGYAYKLGNRLSLGILFNEDLNGFMNEIYQDYRRGITYKSYNRYYFTTQITFSYRLFGEVPVGKHRR